MPGKRINPSTSNLKLGIPMTICLFDTCFVLLDAVDFLTGPVLTPQTGSLLRSIISVAVLISFFGTLLIWWLLGERIMARMRNTGWLVGCICGIPAAVLVTFGTGFLQNLNRIYRWMDPDLLFRLCRMITAAVLPLSALIGYVVFALRHRHPHP